MIYPVYSMKDELIGFGLPQVNINDNVAIRDFREKMKNENHAGDYSLFKIGTYDTDTGSFISNVEFLERGSKNENE